MLPPPKLLLESSTASTSTPGDRDVGAEPVERQHRRREGELLAGSPATAKALRIVASIGCELLGYGVDHSQVPPAASIFSCALGAEAVRVDGQLLRELAAAEDLDRVPLRLARPCGRAASRASPRRRPRSAPRGRRG